MAPVPSKPAILVTDDTALNRHAFNSILEKDYDVTLASSGLEALDHAAARDFAVILLDVRMPQMDGFETAERLRHLPRNRETPIIFLSVHDEMMVPMMKCGYIPGATDFLFGLVDEDLLKLKVATYVAIRLRDDAIKTQLRQLDGMVRALRAEATGASPASAERFRVVEALLDELHRRLGRAGGG